MSTLQKDVGGDRAIDLYMTPKERAKRATRYKKWLTPAEFQLIKHYVENFVRSPSAKMCIKVIMYLGLRVGEATRLKRDDFTKDFSRLTFYPLKKRHCKVHERIVPACLRKELVKYQQSWTHRYREGHLFFPYRNQSAAHHLSTHAIRRHFVLMRRHLKWEYVYHTYTNRRGKACKMYRISPHTLRHHAAWRYYEASGRNIKVVQEMLCHEKFETTASYIHSLRSLEQEEEVVNKAFMEE